MKNNEGGYIMKQKINEKWEEVCKNMKEFDELYHKIANYYNLSDSSFWILYVLYQNPEGCTQKAFYSDWYFNKQTINSSIKYLENKGYITLKFEENSKKFKRIYITQKGIELSKNTIARVIEIENRVFSEKEEKEMNIVINFFKDRLNIFKNKLEELMKDE